MEQIATEPVPWFLDFEASSLASASYPIEVAWSIPDGVIEAHLISPVGIDRWTDWSPQAERLHGINRARLLAEGRPPRWICQRLNDQLAGQTVYTDAPDYDEAWLTELFSVTWGIKPGFRLANADDLLLERLAPQFAHPVEARRVLAALKAEVRLDRPRQHRAGWDVEYLITVWHRVNRRQP